MERKFNDQEIVRREKLQALQKSGNDPYKVEGFKRTHTAVTFKKEFEEFTKEQLHESQTLVKIAGRVMAIRQTFGIIQDFSGSLQFYLNKKDCQEELFERFQKMLDIGDIITISGTPMKTNTGEVTIRIKNFEIVSKALKPLPEKWHGLQDEELRARKRYVDLITSEESRKVFVTRSKIISALRSYLDSVDFIEVETPVLHGILGGANARPFVTHHNALDREYYLRVATELPLKKLIVGGFEKVYEIGRIFRNEGMDATHNPEFTTLEAYCAYFNMDDIMSLIETTILHVAKTIDKVVLTYKDVSINFSKPFRRIHMLDIIKEVTKVDFRLVKTDEEALKLAQLHKVEMLPHQKNKGHIVNLFFENFCESKCLQPTFVYGHPVEVSPLSKKDYALPGYTRRFELFITGKEFANAFAELNDPIDQYNRFQAQIDEKNRGNDEANEMDIDFIEALEYGLPPTGGLGIGIDRLVMLFTNCEVIRDVLLFPHMREREA